MRRTAIERIGLLAVIVLLSACEALVGIKETAVVDAGGEFDAVGEADAIPDAPANSPPTVSVRFPPPVSLTDTATITVRGTATDEDDIQAIRVNGLMVETADGFAHWQVTVPLVHGDNQLLIEAEDKLGNIDGNAAQVMVNLSEHIMSNPTAVALDSENQRALVLDRGLKKIFSIDLNTGKRSVISGPGVGTGQEFSIPVAMTLDSARGRVLVLDSSLDALISVDLGTGQRSVVSGSGSGAGPELVLPQALALDEANNRVLVVDSSLDALLSIDLATRERVVMSNATTGTGPNFSNPTAIITDPAAGKAFIANSYPSALFAVDLATGNRLIFSDSSTGGGPNFSSPQSLALDSVNGRLLVVENYRILAVDIDTGQRSVISDAMTGSGPDWGLLKSIVLESSNVYAFVADYYRGELLKFNVLIGDREIVSGTAVGTGARFQGPIDVKMQGDALIVLDDASQLIGVNVETGERTAYASGFPSYGEDGAFWVDWDENKAWVAGGEDSGLYEVDMSAGTYQETISWYYIDPWDCTVDRFSATGISYDDANDSLLVYGQDWLRGYGYVLEVPALNPWGLDVLSGSYTCYVGSGPTLRDVGGMTFDYMGNRILALSMGALLAIDRGTGDRTAVSSSTVGSGTVLSDPQGVVLDDANSRALVVDALHDAVFAIDLDTGDRTILSSNNLGKGPALLQPRSIAVDEFGRAVVADAARKAAVVIDLETGERVLLSR